MTRFNLGDNFIQWVKTFYNKRKSYVINNGFISSSINMSRGIFQGCPISPFLFLFAIEVLAIAIRSNDDIKGIQVGNMEKKISLLADDTTCFLQGDLKSFQTFLILWINLLLFLATKSICPNLRLFILVV